ncbi:MAG: acylphosphatase [Aquificales bacterium]|nr:acylphosphatase [Aquificales bacterium]
MKRVEATVYGRVQGVSFRYYTQREAIRLNLTGWVANDSDGSVRVVAEGSETEVKKLVDFLHIGPLSATVDKVTYTWHTATNEFHKFSIRWR